MKARVSENVQAEKYTGNKCNNNFESKSLTLNS